MQKSRSTLEHFFSKPLVDILLPHVINAERTPKKGAEKKALVMEELGNQFPSGHCALPTPAGNLTIPWRFLFPIFIDALLDILNIIMGRDWIKEEHDQLAPPKT